MRALEEAHGHVVHSDPGLALGHMEARGARHTYQHKVTYMAGSRAKGPNRAFWLILPQLFGLMYQNPKMYF